MEVVWSPRSTADLSGVGKIYARRDPSLESRAIHRIFESVEQVRRYPRIGTLYKGVRRRRVGGAPFVLFFRERNDRIEIVRVLHVRSDWQSLF